MSVAPSAGAADDGATDAPASDGPPLGVAGVRVGHWTDPLGRTGCTVVLLPEEGAVISGLVAGPAPGSRETALLDPEKSVDRAHALLFAGGSAFGLAAADGVVRWLAERGRGLATPFARVPIVPAAVLYDLGVGSPDARPDAEAGYAASAAAAAGDGTVRIGRVGAGTGATAFKLDGFDRAVATGVGVATERIGGATVAALAISNAVGGLRDPETGAWLAGREVPLDAVADLFAPVGATPGTAAGTTAGTATSLVALVTDAAVDKAGCRALAPAGHVGIAHVTRPSHTANDGDTVFVAATGATASPGVAALGVAAQRAVARALLRGARAGAAVRD